MQSKNGTYGWQDRPWRDGFRRAKEDANRALTGCVFVASLLVSCGGNFDNLSRIESPGEERDSGASGHCIELPWAMAFGFSIDANGAMSHASMDFLPVSRVRLTPSVSTVAQGAPGSERLLAASLISAGGNSLSQVLFDDPRFVNDFGKADHGNSYSVLAIQLVPGATRLVITNWETGAALLDLDLHGDIQLLCLNQPCLNLCATPDGGSSPPVDGGADLSAAIDENGAD